MTSGSSGRITALATFPGDTHKRSGSSASGSSDESVTGNEDVSKVFVAEKVWESCGKSALMLYSSMSFDYFLGMHPANGFLSTVEQVKVRKAHLDSFLTRL